MATRALLTSPEPSLQIQEQAAQFPSTRFMGSKERLLGALWQAIAPFSPISVLDLCSGTGVVSYMLKAQGCRVHANDYMAMAALSARALIGNSTERLTEDDVRAVQHATDEGDRLVQETYDGLYYSPEDNLFIDRARVAIARLPTVKQDIARAALVRSCLKKRARGIFTYTGLRYDDGRKDLKLSLSDHFAIAAKAFNGAVFCNGHDNIVTNEDIGKAPPVSDAELVYLDPPYFSPLSDNQYVRRYHFVEALARDWQGIEIQQHTKTKKFKNYPSPYESLEGARKSFDTLAEFYAKIPIVISYSSNALPEASDVLRILRRHRKRATVTEIDHLYSFGNQGHTIGTVRNKVKELIFTAY